MVRRVLRARTSAKRLHPTDVAVVGIGAEGERPSALEAVEVVEEDVVGEWVFEHAIERAGAFCHFQRALIDEADELADQIAIFDRVVDVGGFDKGSAGGAHGNDYVG